MKKVSVVAAIIAVIMLVLAVLAGRKVETIRTDVVDKEERLERTYMPRLGLKTYLADLRWVWLLQQMGRQQSETLNDKAAEYFADILDGMATVNPDCEKMYTLGASFISQTKPKRAIDLYNKGLEYAHNPQWKWSFYPGFIAKRYLAENNSNFNKKESLKKAEKYYRRTALEWGDSPDFVARSWMQLATRDKAQGGEVQRLVAQKKFLEDLYQRRMGERETPEKSPEKGKMERTGTTSYDNMEDGYLVNTLSNSIVENSKDLLTKLLDEKKQKATEEKKAVTDKIQKIRGVYKDLMTLQLEDDEHICSACLHEYGPGVRHCPTCGAEVEAYGHCKNCWQGDKRLVLLKGKAYCPVCGTANPWKQEQIAKQGTESNPAPESANPAEQ